MGQKGPEKEQKKRCTEARGVGVRRLPLRQGPGRRAREVYRGGRKQGRRRSGSCGCVPTEEGRGGRRRRRSSWELTGRSGLVLFSTIKYWVDFGQESVWSGERKRESRRSVVPAHFKFLGNLIEKCPHFRDMAWKKCVECQYAKLYILISYFCN